MLVRQIAVRPGVSHAAMGAVVGAAHVQVRFASLKKTKQRISASKNIEKITTAMKNVASAKMKGAEAEAKASEFFNVGLNTYLSSLPESHFLNRDGKHMIVPITSDRGLCGAVNTTVVRTIWNDLREIGKERKKANKPPLDFSLGILGSKGKDQLARAQSKNINIVFDEIQKKNPSFAQACAMTDELLQYEFDTLTIYYTKFVNTGSQIPSTLNMLSPTKVEELATGLDEYECEPDKQDLMQAMYTFYFAANLYHSLCTSIASEQASRMVAMDGASRNAKDMIQKLTILFNRTRQAIITGQLIEITSAAESIK